MPKYFRTIPKLIRAKLASLSANEFITAAVVRMTKTDIQSGKYKKFGIDFQENKIIFKDKFTPSPPTGKYSRINRYGKILVRKDLPMVSKSYSFEAPDYGDWSNGSHEVTFERPVYQREKVNPLNIEFLLEKLSEDENSVVFAFKTSDSLTRGDQKLEDRVLFNVNLLKENFGTCDLFASDETLKEKLLYGRLKWEVLPPGWWRDKSQVEKITARLESKRAALFMERVKNIEEMGPIESYAGQSYLGNRLYFVFVFPKIVVAECPMFGNALYYVSNTDKKYWTKVFSSTKRQALGFGAQRLPHSGSWTIKLKELLAGGDN